MILFRKADLLRDFLHKQKFSQKLAGFVPTMGALHEGHISLIKLSNQHADITISSIFVNPTQFNDPKDFESYPVALSHDIQLLEQANCDVLFLPGIREIYPEGISDTNRYDIGPLESILEGAHRPGHFMGVCQVVDKLLHIVKPDKLFLGQKDYQQTLIIKKLISDLKLPIEVVVGETSRLPSGLAMSSRNTRLTADAKMKAAALYQTLRNIKNNFSSTSFEKLISYSQNFLLHEGFSSVDYVMIANAETLVPIEQWDGSAKLIALAAATINDVRLIDNLMLN